MDDFIYFDYNQKSSVLLIFFFNAVLFSILLLKKGVQEHRTDSKILAMLIFLCGLYICPFLLGYGGWYSKRVYREFLFFMPFQQLFLIGPVLYFYVQSLLNFEFKLSRKDLIHLLPALAYGGYSVLVWIVDRWVLNEFYFYADGQDKDLDFWYQMAGLISMLLYLGLSHRHYKKYRAFTLQEASFADEISYRWIEHFLFAFAFILLLRVVFFIVNPEWGEFGSKYWFYVCFSILFLYIAVTGYSTVVKTTLPFSIDLKLPIATVNKTRSSSETKLTEHNPTEPQWRESINALFEVDELYTNPNLTLTDVANHLDTNRNVVSNAINSEFEMNFNDYVNSWRTRQVIRLLEEKEHHGSTLLGIAIDCGFNSKTTFNRAFKKHTGLSPKQYIDKFQL